MVVRTGRHRKEGGGGVSLCVAVSCFLDDVHDIVGTSLMANPDSGGI